MKVKLLVEFDVEGPLFGNDKPLTEAYAKSAASEAVHNFLCMTIDDKSVRDIVEVHVDGYGACEVKLGKDHE